MMKTSKIVVLLSAVLAVVSVQAQERLNVAQYTANNELQYPSNLHEWIQTGVSLGSEYSDAPFDPAKPGTLGVVQMEPTAYRYFMEHKSYAEGTMFLLSFYRAESKSEPQLPGFVQGPLLQQEIHVLDTQRFSDGHGFFLYRGEQKVSTALPVGNDCTACHLEHGKFEGTFVQFYPALREKLGLAD
jgi:Cytochrome P460